MLPSAECARPLQGDRGLPAQHNFGPVDGSRPRARRGWCDTGHAWRSVGRTRSCTRRLSSVLASTYVSAESSDSWSDRSATVAMSNQPKICCANDSTIGNAAFPTGRDQHASSQMRLRAQRGTQHSSARNIGRRSDRASVIVRRTNAIVGTRRRGRSGCATRVQLTVAHRLREASALTAMSGSEPRSGSARTRLLAFL